MASGLADLLSQIGSDDVAVAVAGGDAQGGLGTSAEAVEAAIVQADRGSGVVLIPDLGSSVLTVRAVLEPGTHGCAILVDAPFVEGAVAAVVTAASGATADEVAKAATEARDVHKF
jgi:PTS hybrid protein